jgi:hypothetical protein
MRSTTSTVRGSTRVRMLPFTRRVGERDRPRVEPRVCADDELAGIEHSGRAWANQP